MLRLRNLWVSVIVLAGLICSVGLNAQTDRDFWFVIPKVTTELGTGGASLGFTITTYDLPATVNVTMPANGAFTPIQVTIPANSVQNIDLSAQVAQVENAFAALGSIQGKNNKGIHITSSSLINVVFESKRSQNPETFTLKGQAALGSDFYASFQTRMYNYSQPTYTAPPYSAFDVVFTENNTTLTLVIPPGKSIYNGGGAPLTGTVSLGPFNAGETYTGIPAKVTAPEVTGFYANDVYGRAAEDHLAGVRITAGGGKKIAVTLKDDALKSLIGNSADLIGDQTIPISQLGTQYIAVKGTGLAGSQNPSFYVPPPANPVSTEELYILATANNTPIYINDTLKTTLNAGQTYVYDVPSPRSYTVVRTTGSPFYCYQLTGVGSDLGDDILPRTDICNGSTRVKFSRSTSQEFYMYILVQKNAKDGFMLNGATSSFITASAFTDIPNTNWAFARIGTLNTVQVPVGSSTELSNTKDVFHLMILNGTSVPTNPTATTGGARFSVFSSYLPVSTQISGFITETGTNTAKICYGQSVHMQSTGGVTYSWDPNDYLSDRYSPAPTATPLASTLYTVTIAGACSITDTLQFRVYVALPMEARFNIDTSSGCAPLYLKIRDQSYGVLKYNWDFGDGTTATWNSLETVTHDTTFIHAFANPTRPYLDRRIRLIVQNTYLCRDTLDRTVRVYPQVTAAFKASPDTIGCHPFAVNFTNTSVNADIYQWQFGDGASAATYSPDHTYSNTGSVDSIYPVRLISTSVYYCADTANTTIRVHPFLRADFTANPSQGCSPLGVNILNQSVGGSTITSYQWSFGDGATSTSGAATLSHTYLNNTGSVQNLPLKLVVRNAMGCTDSLIRTIQVYPKVSAQFAQDQTAGCNPLRVAFTRPVNLAPVSYDWSFGDGVSSSVSDPIHTFSNLTPRDTIYSTTLVVTSPNLCTDTFRRDFSVYRYIKASFSADPTSGCYGFDTHINNNSTVYAGISSVAWSFGDGGTTTGNLPTLVHHYQNNTDTLQNRTLKMTVSNIHGCVDSMAAPVSIYPAVVASFSADNMQGCTPLTVGFVNATDLKVAKNFYWTFGDGSSDSAVNPVHQFVNLAAKDTLLQVRMIAVSKYFCADTQQMYINVYSHVSAGFSVDTSSGCSPFAPLFQNNSLGGISSYEWNFGDGSPLSSLFQPSHSYVNTTLASQLRNIRLVVKNMHGCSDTAFRLVTVYPQVKASFSADVTAGCNPLDVNFANSSNAAATVFNWDFGDLASSSLANPSHTYYNLGPADSVRTVRLHALSPYGCWDDTTGNITTYAYVDADFKVVRPDICSNTDLQISNTSLGGITQNSWDFENDGIYDLVSADTALSHSYTNLTAMPVVRNLKLMVRNSHGCLDSMIRPITVYPKVTAAFSADSAGCHPFSTQFVNASLEGNAALGSNGDYFWDFGDTTTSTLENPAKIYYDYNDVDISYTARLVAVSPYFCKDSITKTFLVYHRPRAIFAVDKTIDCPPLNLQISNTSVTSNSTFYWDFGDGQYDTLTSKLTFGHTYFNPGSTIKTYTLNMKAVTNYGCSDSTRLTFGVYPGVTAAFTFDSAGCSPYTSSLVNHSVNAFYYAWDFADGQVSALLNPSHIFNNSSEADKLFNVRLTAISLNNCKDSVSHNILVYAQPAAMFIPSPEHQVFQPGAKITITNLTDHQSTWDYQWDFGDGTTSTDHDAMFDKPYANWAPNDSGNFYNISMRATNPLHPQCTDTVTDRVRIFPPPPHAFVTNSDTAGCVPLTVNFSFNSSYSYPDSVYWDFGDGTNSRDANPSHTYPQAGLYNVSVRVVGDGGVYTAYQHILAYPLPNADFDVAPRVVMLPTDHIEVINKSSRDSSWTWNFGDGTTSDERQPQHVYSAVGVYDVSLIVQTEHHCSDTLVKSRIIEVVPAGLIEFPTAFSPDLAGPSDGRYNGLSGLAVNNIFYPHYSGVDKYHLEIYTRWGELIFTSDDITIGWDGYYHGKLCKQDVYVWKATGKFVNGRSFMKAGDVTLLQKKD